MQRCQEKNEKKVTILILALGIIEKLLGLALLLLDKLTE